jgi:hypothetical protein
MQMYVQWDHENEDVVFGPQGTQGDGGNWYAYVDSGDIVNPRTQTRRFVFVEEIQMVLGVVEGDPEQTWLQKRQASYGGLEDQFDMLWHDINDGALDQTGVFYTHIKTVKDNNPKGD